MQERILGLDGLRAIAVMMVLCSHKFPIGKAISFGGFGVHLFFVLSGFLIIGILHDRRHAVEAGVANIRFELSRFYLKRLYRIWPPYYLFVAAILLFSLAGFVPPLSGEERVAVLTFSSNIFQAYVWTDYPDYWGHLWSVAVEEQFYLWIAPVMLMSSSRRAGSICILIMLAALLFGIAQHLAGASPRAAYVGSVTNFGLMAFGGVLAIFRRRDMMAWQWTSRVASPALIAYLLCPFYQIALYPLPRLMLFWSSPMLVGIVLLGIAGDQRSGLVCTLETSWLRYLGRISYGLYLYHHLAILPADSAGWLSQPSVRAAVESVIAVTIASLSWHILERPLLRHRQAMVEPGLGRRIEPA